MLLRRQFAGIFAAALTMTSVALAGPISTYSQTNLVSDIPGMAAVTDPNLKNPWGISFSSTSPFWVSDNATGLTTLYNSSGTPQSLVVSIPGAGGNPAAPTGQVFNGGPGFNADLFIFASEDGTVAGWNPGLGSTAEVLFDNSGSDAIYKGLAIGSIGANTYLYATDFHNGAITVFKSTGAPDLAGQFLDPNIPSGFAPFNIQNIDGKLYVTYAKQDADAEDDVAGAGNGFVNVFDLNGNLLNRLAAHGALNSPWGMALAPTSWGFLAGNLLVGNFGDGTINAFDANGNLLGTLADANGNPLVNDGLWGLTFGNGGSGGDPNSLYITAGLNDEENGLFARIEQVPEPATLSLLGAGLAVLGLKKRRGRVRNHFSTTA